MNKGIATSGSRLVERLRLTVAERRVELGISLAELARCSGVGRATIRRIEHGDGRVAAARIVAVSRALTELELHRPPATLEDELLGIVGQMRLPGDGWAV
jgi:transcriptional regulator with XRE-family HTH domain